jgi:3-oxo-4-pregnene-20-carboxyl-CoA dehydrogenase beta subunit
VPIAITEEQRAKRNTVLTFGGGSNEILWELIATAGLRLPRVPR